MATIRPRAKTTFRSVGLEELRCPCWLAMDGCDQHVHARECVDHGRDCVIRAREALDCARDGVSI
ncbi:hypothetical protein CsSME_00034633 [Camellia sinensis var. sinensis]